MMEKESEARKCLLCKRTLGTSDPLSLDCGGDCVVCMAEAGDPGAIEYIAELEKEGK